MPKQPTNSDILGKLERMDSILQLAVKDVGDLKAWRRDIEISKRAVDEYRQVEARDQLQKGWLDILKQLSPFLVAATVLAYALSQAVHK